MHRHLQWAWARFLTLLEIIGLRDDQGLDPRTQLALFRTYHAEFRKLLSANNHFLEGIAELEAKLSDPGHVDRNAMRSRVSQMATDVHHMVRSLNVIADDRYAALWPVLEELSARLNQMLTDARCQSPVELWMPLSAIASAHADIVGGKMANLGEIKNVLGLPAPDGFAITTEGYRLHIERNGLASLIQQEHVDFASVDEAASVSRRLQERLLASTVPAELEQAILAAYDQLSQRLGWAPPLAVRSSALGEDGHLSFAGQFETVLNVPREGLRTAYLHVIASLFSPEAVHYRVLHKIPGESASMAVGFVTMVDASASGIVFSREPTRQAGDALLIQAVEGLGAALADGQLSPQQIRVGFAPPHPILSRSRPSQPHRLACGDGDGVIELPVVGEHASIQTVSDEQARDLARWAVALEIHFGAPQDIEWAAGQDRSLVLLQTRPLRLTEAGADAREPVPGYPVLLTEGDVACPGVGIGPAVHLDVDGDLESFPDGGVLVAPRSSPRFVRVMNKARAIVTDAGGTTGHMASLAREFRVPTLLNTRRATKVLPAGRTITVDASRGHVYLGEVPGLSPPPRGATETVPVHLRPARTAIHECLERWSTLLVPLNLVDPRSADFLPENCRTLHDVTRFVHEMSYVEMFQLRDKLGNVRASSYALDVFLPIDLYLIDVGGGLIPPARGARVSIRQVTSVPLRALLDGMLDKRIPRYGPRPMDVRGFVSIMMRHAATNPEDERSFRDPCYAIISDRYLNYTARVGYHFGVVDTYCGATANKNYISMLFRGGAADRVRRIRRVRVIANILRRQGFLVSSSGDVVTARLSKASQADTVEQLAMVGRLLQFMRQMDLAMASDAAARWVEEAFLSGDFRLEMTPPPSPAP